MTPALTEIPETPTRHEVTEKLAYGLWEERGNPLGDSEADWFRAESILQEGATARVGEIQKKFNPGVPLSYPETEGSLVVEASVPVKKQAELTEWQQEVKAAEDKIGAFAHSVKKALRIEK